MPELPEVETTCAGIRSALVGSHIQQVVVRQYKLRYPVNDDLAARLLGQSIIAITRRAKYIIIQLSSGYLLIHLGMSGHLRVLQSTPCANKHDHIDIIHTDGQCLRYTDPRRFGLVLWADGLPDQHRLLKHLGPEPLERSFNAKQLYAACQKRTVAIKALIMNNAIVVGVGNIYAQESLFLAGIHPMQAANSLSLESIERLVKHIKQVLRKAIKQGGTSLNDFFNTDGKPGYFKQSLHVYGRANKGCTRCNTPLQSQLIAQRNTVFCSECQPNRQPANAN